MPGRKVVKDRSNIILFLLTTATYYRYATFGKSFTSFIPGIGTLPDQEYIGVGCLWPMVQEKWPRVTFYNEWMNKNMKISEYKAHSFHKLNNTLVCAWDPVLKRRQLEYQTRIWTNWLSFRLTFFLSNNLWVPMRSHHTDQKLFPNRGLIHMEWP